MSLNRALACFEATSMTITQLVLRICSVGVDLADSVGKGWTRPLVLDVLRELRDSKLSESGDVVLVGDDVHKNVEDDRSSVGAVVVGNVGEIVIMVEVVHIVDHRTNRLGVIVSKRDDAFDGFLRTSAARFYCREDGMYLLANVTHLSQEVGSSAYDRLVNVPGSMTASDDQVGILFAFEQTA